MLIAAQLGLACHPRQLRPATEITRPDELLERTGAIEQAVRNIRGQSKIRIISGRVRGTSTAFVAVQRPASIHLEVLDFFGRPQSIFASDGEDFSLFNSDERKFYRGPATPANLARFFAVPLPGKELVKLMLGEAPRISTSQATMSFDPKLGAYRLELRDNAITQRLQIEASSYRVLQSQVEGSKGYWVEFAEFISPPLSFPRRIALELPSAPASVEIRYTAVKLNDVLEASLFHLSAPAGAEVVDLDGSGSSAGRDSVPGGHAL